MTYQEIKQLTDAQLRDIIITKNAAISQIKRDLAVVKEISEEACEVLVARYYEMEEEANPYRIAQGQRMMQEQMQYITKEEWSSIVD
jgi:hypothetical protein